MNYPRLVFIEGPTDQNVLASIIETGSFDYEITDTIEISNN